MGGNYFYKLLDTNGNFCKKGSEYINLQCSTKLNPQLNLIDSRKNKINTFANTKLEGLMVQRDHVFKLIGIMSLN